MKWACFKSCLREPGVGSINVGFDLRVSLAMSPIISLPLFHLYGDPPDERAFDLIHIETISSRSSIHDWTIDVHRHSNLWQILVIERGGGDMPVTQETSGDRIELKNLAKQAVHQLQVAGEDKRTVAAVAEQLDLADVARQVEARGDLEP